MDRSKYCSPIPSSYKMGYQEYCRRLFEKGFDTIEVRPSRDTRRFKCWHGTLLMAEDLVDKDEMNRKKSRRSQISCPHKDCSIGRLKNGTRQHPFDLDLHEEIPAGDRQKMSGKPLYWCGYCDCIYSFESGRYHIFGINKGSSWISLNRNLFSGENNVGENSLEIDIDPIR